MRLTLSCVINFVCFVRWTYLKTTLSLQFSPEYLKRTVSLMVTRWHNGINGRSSCTCKIRCLLNTYCLFLMSFSHWQTAEACLSVVRSSSSSSIYLPHFHIKLQTYIMRWQATRKTQSLTSWRPRCPCRDSNQIKIKSNHLLFMDDKRIHKLVVLKHGNQYSVKHITRKNI